MLIEFLAAGVLAVAGAGLLAHQHQQARSLRLQAEQLQRSLAVRREYEALLAQRKNLAEWQQVLEGSMDEGTRAARAVHHGVANVSFDILEAIPVTRDTSRVVREIHDLTADSVYAAIGGVNRLLGKGSRRVIKVSPRTEQSSDGESDSE